MKRWGVRLFFLGATLLMLGGVVGLKTLYGGRVTNQPVVNLGAIVTIVALIILFIGMLIDKISSMESAKVSESKSGDFTQQSATEQAVASQEATKRNFTIKERMLIKPTLLWKLEEDNCSVVRNGDEWVITNADGSTRSFTSLADLETYIEMGEYK